ncbi:MAG: RsmB/NOP family class I SAM-dependent RNA methyltransferase [Pseudomonadota bacterium]
MTRTRRKDRDRNSQQPEKAGLAARRAALRLICDVLDNGGMLSDPGGPGQQAAEARALADAVIRHLPRIDAVIGTFVDRMPKSPVSHVLRLMAADLLIRKTPPHAGVDSAVALVKADRRSERFAGLINAVGRKISDRGHEIFQETDHPGLWMPDWMIPRLSQDWGAETASEIAKAGLEQAPIDITLKVPDDAQAFAQECSGTVLPTKSVRLNNRPQISALPGYSDGAWWVQDAAACLPAVMLNAQAGERVLDLCAAPGGKTLQLAATRAKVTALDISKRRMDRLQKNLDRTGLNAELVIADAFAWAPEAPFDAILIDAPCSATGTLRRHPELPHRLDQGDLDALCHLQDRLLRTAFDWLKPGGRLVFSTCSLFKSEGEDRIASFLEQEPDAKVSKIGSDDGVPADLISENGWLRSRPDMWPEIGSLDGFFAVRLVRG